MGKGLYELSRNGKIVKTKANIARLKVYKKEASKRCNCNRSKMKKPKVKYTEVIYLTKKRLIMLMCW